MTDKNQEPEHDDDLGSMSLGFRILFVLCFAWLLLAYQIVNPGVYLPFPWSEYFVIGPAPVLIVVALYGIWSTLRKKR